MGDLPEMSDDDENGEGVRDRGEVLVSMALMFVTQLGSMQMTYSIFEHKILT